jgi:hypothetical protein
MLAPGKLPRGLVFTKETKACESGYVSGFSRTASITENTAEFTPMATAITRIAIAANPGVFLSARNAKEKSRTRSSI